MNGKKRQAPLKPFFFRIRATANRPWDNAFVWRMGFFFVKVIHPKRPFIHWPKAWNHRTLHVFGSKSWQKAIPYSTDGFPFALLSCDALVKTKAKRGISYAFGKKGRGPFVLF